MYLHRKLSLCRDWFLLLNLNNELFLQLFPFSWYLHTSQVRNQEIFSQVLFLLPKRKKKIFTYSIRHRCSQLLADTRFWNFSKTGSFSSNKSLCWFNLALFLALFYVVDFTLEDKYRDMFCSLEWKLSVTKHFVTCQAIIYETKERAFCHIKSLNADVILLTASTSLAKV